MCRNAETLLQVSVIREPFVGPRLSPGDAGSAAAARSGFEAPRTLRERPAAQRPRRPRAAPAARPQKERLRGGTARGDGAAAVPSEQASAPSRPGQAARRRGSPSGPVPTEDEEEEKEAAPFPQPPPRGTHSNTCSEVQIFMAAGTRLSGSGASPPPSGAGPGRPAGGSSACAAGSGRGLPEGAERRRPIPARRSGDAEVAEPLGVARRASGAAPCPAQCGCARRWRRLRSAWDGRVPSRTQRAPPAPRGTAGRPGRCPSDGFAALK